MTAPWDLSLGSTFQVDRCEDRDSFRHLVASYWNCTSHYWGRPGILSKDESAALGATLGHAGDKAPHQLCQTTKSSHRALLADLSLDPWIDIHEDLSSFALRLQEHFQRLKRKDPRGISEDNVLLRDHLVEGLRDATLRERGWSIDVNRHIDAVRGSDVLIRCNFSYPSQHHTNNVKVFWKKDESKENHKKGDTNPFVFHPDSSQITELYSGRTSLVGIVKEGNCSLRIKNVTQDESNLYVRIETKKYFSFYNYLVSIKVNDSIRRAVTSSPALVITQKVIRTSPQVTSSATLFYTTEPLALTPRQNSAFPLHLIISIAVPISSILILGIVVLVVFLICRKFGRERSLNRTSSGYYANFSRRSDYQTKSTHQDPGVKAIDDEPVYSNIQPHQLRAEMDESIYANM
ncbi:hypothetical protein WMY93_008610 [Mugilogobius chulae]|uniref:Immunoglobulin V-set domain-containing protein n=1 Tax=Mugilogobius chulae TaxID=88201 RepID=A0AAW0PS81_9GOBI